MSRRHTGWDAGHCVNCGQETELPRWCSDCWWMLVKGFISGLGAAIAAALAGLVFR